MTVPAPPPWVRLLDLGCIGLVALAFLIQSGSGVGFSAASPLISTRAVWAVLSGASALLAVRLFAGRPYTVPGPPPLRARLLDVAAVVFLVMALAVGAGFGFRLAVGNLVISVRSARRAFAWALGLLAVRQAIDRTEPSFVWQWAWLRAAARRAFEPEAARPEDEVRPFGRLGRPAAAALLVAIFALVAALVTAPQALHLDGVPDRGDPLFSTWRLAWIAHQLPRNPIHLFDANIFYPERFTLAFSDSVLVEGLMALPLLRAGVNAVTVYNLVFLAGFAISGMTMFVLAWSLTRNTRASLVAGLLFACYPYRLAHYSHIEEQFACWMPLALLSLRRVVMTGRVRDGLALGASLALQALSIVYYALFLSVYLVPVWATLALGWKGIRRSIRPLAWGAVLAAVLVAPVATAHFAARTQQGERSRSEVQYYSAHPGDYLVAPVKSALYGKRLAQGRVGERELFPGLLIVALALIGLWPPLSATRTACAAGLLVAYVGSLGLNGFLYPWLYDYVVLFRGLRVPARFAMLVGFSLSVLAGYGTARILRPIRAGRAKSAVAGALCLVALFESRADLTLESVPRRPPAVYAWFRGRPPAVLVEFPFPRRESDTWWDARYMYYSTFHWQKLVNGNSGFLPPSYLQMMEALSGFPDDSAFAALRRRGADYLVVHGELYDAEVFARVTKALEDRTDVVEVTRSGAPGMETRLYRLVPP